MDNITRTPIGILDTYQYLDFDSQHPVNHKLGVVGTVGRDMDHKDLDKIAACEFCTHEVRLPRLAFKRVSNSLKTTDKDRNRMKTLIERSCEGAL